MDHLNKNITDWSLLARFLAHETTEGENQRLIEWLEQDPANSELLSKMAASWDENKTSPELTEKAWEQFSKKSTQPKAVKKEFLRKNLAIRIVQFAAIFLLTVGVSLAGLKLFETIQQHSIVTVTAQNKTLKQVKLPDNSVITLYPGSSVSYPKKFAKNKRKIEFKGKAFFEIFRDTSRVFEINTDQSLVTVLGTSFQVSNIENGKNIEVIVATGKVAISGIKPNNSVIEFFTLQAGESGSVLTDGKAVKETQIDANYLSWKTHVLTFSETELERVAHTLYQTYGYKVDYSDVASQKLRLSAHFDNRPLAEVLQVIALSLNLEVDTLNEKITFKAKK